MPYKGIEVARAKAAERQRRHRARVTPVTPVTPKTVGVTASGAQGVTRADVTPVYRVVVRRSNQIGAARPCPRCQAPAGHISGFCHLASGD